MKNLLGTVLFLLFIGHIINETTAQNCTIDNPLVIEAKNLNENFIAQKIKDIKPEFNEIKIAELNLQIKKCNNDIDNQIALLKSQLQNVSMDKQELLKVKDIQKIKEQIAEKEKSRDNINKQIEADLQNLNFKGLFIVVLKNIDPLSDSKEALSVKGDGLISPKAIDNLNGAFISSLTEVKNAVTISDYIKSVVSGEMVIEKPLISKINPKYRIFVYLAKVSVSPLKKSNIANNKYFSSMTDDNLVINAMEEKTYKDKLSGFGLTYDVILEIEMEINAAFESIISENDLASRREKDIMAKGNENLQEISKEIGEIKDQLKNRSQILKTTIESKTNIIYDESNSDLSINAAIKYFDDKMDDLKKKMLEQKENELLSRFDVPVPYEGIASTDIAKKSLDICAQMRSTYSKVEKFMEVVEVENAVVTNYQSGTSKDIYRTLDKIWLFPVAGENDNYFLTVIAKFKITEIKTSDHIKHDNEIVITNEPIPTGSSLTDIRDGKIYRIVEIGNQTWMAENLAYKTNNGCWAYDNNLNNGKKYGYLYTWEMAKNACPSGWHLPTDEEWTRLSDYLGGEKVAGAKLKSQTGWDDPKIEATNSSGFTAIPGGYRYYTGIFNGEGSTSGWWSATKSSSTYAWWRLVNSTSYSLSRPNYDMKYGLSVRCVRNSK